jgi:hypothetical protein
MGIRIDDVQRAVRIPSQRADSPAPPVRSGAANGEVVSAGPLSAPRPTPADVVVGAVTLTLGAARSATEIGVLAGQVALDRLPIPGFVRDRSRRAWLTAGSVGMRRRALARQQLDALLDLVVPELVRTVLARLDVVALVREYVDIDRIAAGLDVDAVAARLDVDRVVDRVDLDRAVARVDLDRAVAGVDLDRVIDRVDLDRVVGRIDLDEIASRIDIDAILDRVDLDAVVARVDLDPVLERADIVGLARYVIDAIDLPELIRASTGSMTSDLVRGVRAQGADADEAVQRVVDRLLRRRGRRDEPTPDGER